MGIKYPALLLMLLALFLLPACSGSGEDTPDLDGSEWRLIEMNGEAIPEEVEINIAFSEDQISGQSACNRYFAGYEQDGSKLTVGQAGSTQMYCEGLMTFEVDYLQGLSEVKSFQLENNIMTMKDESDTAILVFSKQD